ncbi:MAG TPA: O-antigen ligase family protein, partial [Candidatus Kapabacteria bacterium]
PLVLLFFTFLFSWWRGCMMKQEVAFVLEFHDIFELPYMFLIISSAFRTEEDREMLWKIILYAAIAKAFDGASLYFFSHAATTRWGVVQSWRDGYMLGITVIGTLILLNYRGTSLRPLRRLLLWIAPVLSLCFMMSFRRTFFVGTFVCMTVMFFSMPSGRRGRHFWFVSAILGVAVLTVFATNPIEVVTRLSGITSPQNEGSAYIRLMEWPNVIQNILHHPLFGVPVGIPWKTYYRMPLSAVYTTLGTHSTYLYWPLRGGIPGLITFIWLMSKAWKSALINYRLRTTEEDFFFGQWGIQMLVMYQVACFFGLMYADMLTGVLAVILTAFQLQTRKVTGRASLREVAFLQTMRQGKLVYREPLLRKLYALVTKRGLRAQLSQT